ncbi:hypothetical protein L596_005653 [Steinernema carpocapsae]|nr:hypothetical protein L596_005653 [Steinernema carpocapsae]
MRQKELKRNKKQRTMVRQAIVKARNPSELLESVRKLDDQEFDISSEFPKAVIAEKRNKLLCSFKEIINMHRNDKNERQAKQLEGMLRVYNEERADRENHYRAAKFAAMEDPNAIPLPTGTGYMDPNVAMTPQGMAFPLTMPQRSILKKPLQKSVVHSTPPGPPCSLAPVLSDSEDEDHEDSSRRGRVRFGGKETRVYNDDVSEDNYEPVEVPASIFSGQRAMGVPLPPGLAPPPPRPNFGGPPVSRFSYGVPVGPPQSVISADPEVRGEATISAGPQMRDMRGEATRFVPTTLRVNRQKSKAVPPRLPPKPAASSEGKSTDEAYADFMKEIEGFM